MLTLTVHVTFSFCPANYGLDSIPSAFFNLFNLSFCTSFFPRSFLTSFSSSSSPSIFLSFFFYLTLHFPYFYHFSQFPPFLQTHLDHYLTFHWFKNVIWSKMAYSNFQLNKRCKLPLSVLRPYSRHSPAKQTPMPIQFCGFSYCWTLAYTIL